MYQTIIIDNGTGFCQAGLGGEDSPQTRFPTITGKIKNNSITYIGNETQSKRDTLTLTHPIEHGIIKNFEHMEKIWQYTFQNELNVSPSEYGVLLTESPLNPKENREKTTEIMFEKFSTPAMCLLVQSVLALLASGRHTGLVLESGEGSTHAVPIFENSVLPHSIIPVPVSGLELTQYLTQLLAENGHSFIDSEFQSERDVVSDIKEKLCFVSLDFEKEMNENFEKTYELPDGNLIKLGNELIKCPESLFQPTLIGSELKGVHQSLYESILKNDIDIRGDFYSNIVLSGGSTLFKGFPERITEEISKLAPISMKVKVVAPPERKFSTWIGGSIFSELKTNEFMGKWISKNDYEEFGNSIVHKKCF
jgi:actin-related protein